MKNMICLNNDWQFTPNWSEDFLNGSVSDSETVRIPHTVKLMPLHYSDDADYQMISGYRKKVLIPESAKGKRVFLQFDGAAHIATLYVNGKEICIHKGGYTAFRAEITDLVKVGEECDVVVRLDSTENKEVPPFGYVIDYLTYGGIYRNVWLDIEEPVYVSDIFVTTPETDTIHMWSTIDGADGVSRIIRIKERSYTTEEPIRTKSDSRSKMFPGGMSMIPSCMNCRSFWKTVPLRQCVSVSVPLHSRRMGSISMESGWSCAVSTVTSVIRTSAMRQRILCRWKMPGS